MKGFYLFVLFVCVAVISSCQKQDVQPQSSAKSQSSVQSQVATDTTSGQSITSSLATITLPAAIPTPSAMIAKWSLVKDSRSWDYGPSPIVSYSDYTGLSTDYYDFRADGKCYTRVGNVYDTLTYTATVGNQIILQKFGPNVNGYYLANDITELTEHSFSIVTPQLDTPMGWSKQELYLAK